VNLSLVHTLLTAANEQPYGFLRVRGADLIREVELMAAAGLVEASRAEDGDEPIAVINRVTDSGEAFLRAFQNQPPAAKEAGAFASVQ
jgi:DNA-binding PadR family transcriptional regulator